MNEFSKLGAFAFYIYFLLVVRVNEEDCSIPLSSSVLAEYCHLVLAGFSECVDRARLN